MKKIVVALLGIAIVATPVFAATWYVSPNGNDANSGATWALAKKTIQEGVNAASVGDTVLVTNGTYVLEDQVSVNSGITVKSVNGAYLTVVNGNYPVTTNRCFLLDDVNAILDGFTITGGYNDGGHGGGVCVNAGTVSSCIVISNSASLTGGGVLCAGGVVTQCVVSGNSASCAGGVQLWDGRMENCIISNNVAIDESSGGLQCQDGCVVLNCVITANRATNGWGGGVLCYSLGIGPGARVVGCEISRNWARSSGGANIGSNALMESCVVSDNGALNDNGGVENSGGTVQNCIVYYNENGDFSGDAPRYSCAPGLSVNGNITNAPQFVDAANGNYRLQVTSPCINTGINQDWMINSVDLDGRARIIGGIVDMGAFETPLPFAPIGVSASDGTYMNKVRVTWDASSGASSYEVWRHTSNNSGSASKISGPDLTETSYDDTSAAAGTTYYYWVKAVNAAGAIGFSSPDCGFVGVVGPMITANGLVGDVYLDGGDPVAIAVRMMNIEPYIGTPVDWWVVACAGSSWYYLNSEMVWIQESNVLNWHPAYQGGLFNLPPCEVLDISLPRGTYIFYFAVDLPMNGILNLEQIYADSVTVTVQ